MVALRALIVDDSGVMRKMVMKGLSDAKLAAFEFVEAADGQEALAKFDPKAIDIGFIDWNMPNMNGVDFVREIRALYGGGMSGVPLVMVTSEKTMGKIEEALDEAGADAFICKPFTVEELQSKLKKTIERAGIRRIRREAAEKKKQQEQSGGLLAKLFG
jgi:two-component system chemotaxis response regulator CheY